MRAIFVRHGQSTANIGIFTPGFANIPLTELGHHQAAEIAAHWPVRPDLIAVSPYLRAQQTARYTMERFPDVPVETWDIHEFTYWDPAYWSNGDPADYPESRARYWGDADPAARQGEGAETFAELLHRARTVLLRLQAQPPFAVVILFTHGHFIQAVRNVILYPQWSDHQVMQNFLAFDEAQKVLNTQSVIADFDGRMWRLE
jgi:broad specificity phosphatase PhoE